MSLKPRSVHANGLEFGYLSAGPEDGRLALLLHGFPDTAYTWRHLMPVLADAGFHAVAPFLRGYAPTEVPKDGLFQTAASMRDVLALHDAFDGGSDAVLIGHDWGALIAYGLAPFAPDKWSRVVTAAVPPMAAMGNGFFQYDQLRRSWYIFFFQNPLAEMVVGADDLAFIERLWGDWSPGFDATEDMGYLRASIGAPENLAAAIGFYRAMFDPMKQSGSLAAEQAASNAPPPQPTLYLHG